METIVKQNIFTENQHLDFVIYSLSHIINLYVSANSNLKGRRDKFSQGENW
jgi:hypothetical protein